jgi:hypothetical protein
MQGPNYIEQCYHETLWPHDCHQQKNYKAQMEALKEQGAELFHVHSRPQILGYSLSMMTRTHHASEEQYRMDIEYSWTLNHGQVTNP